MNKGTQQILYTRWYAVTETLLDKGYSPWARALMDCTRALLELDPAAYADSQSREAMQQVIGFLGSIAGAQTAGDPACWLVLPLLNAMQAALLGDPSDVRAALATLDKFLAPHLAETWG
jgi:hypothetical protein